MIYDEQCFESGRVRKLRRVKIESDLLAHQAEREERKRKNARLIRRCRKAKALWEKCRG